MSLPQSSRSADLSRLIRTATLTIDPRGRVAVLAEKAGVHVNTIHAAIRNGRCSLGLASLIEGVVGEEVLSRKQLCPEKFDK